MSAQGFGVDVLAFGAHPDDVELCCGGTLIRMADLGRSTGVIDLTRGELASNGTVEARAQEASEAARVMGLRFRENLGLPDGGVQTGAEADRSVDSQLGRAVEALRRHRPELVLLPWLEERHPDHAAAGALLTRAVYFAGLAKFETRGGQGRFVPRQVLYYPMRVRLRPSLVVDTTEAAERKRQAMGCYQSQLTRASGAVPTLVSSPRALQAVEARDRYYGSMIGTECGEPLRAPNTLGVRDLVGHFRENPFSEAHAFEALR